jgi:hypothetical protein
MCVVFELYKKIFFKGLGRRFVFASLITYKLKGHSSEKLCQTITLNYSLVLNCGPPTYFNFFKSPLEK